MHLKLLQKEQLKKKKKIEATSDFFGKINANKTTNNWRKNKFKFYSETIIWYDNIIMEHQKTFLDTTPNQASTCRRKIGLK